MGKKSKRQRARALSDRRAVIQARRKVPPPPPPVDPREEANHFRALYEQYTADGMGLTDKSEGPWLLRRHKPLGDYCKAVHEIMKSDSFHAANSLTKADLAF